jgi:hypothetical protein
MKNIAVLIPITSNKRNWENLKETDLYSHFFKSFFSTYSPEYYYTIYLGIDNDDDLYKQVSVQKDIDKFINIMKNSSVKMLFFDKKKYKGKPCWIWNELFKDAVKDNNDFFIQCGSDISFIDKNWVECCINNLNEKKGFGVVGLIDQGRKEFNSNDSLLTQTMVSKKHFDIFGFYFPWNLPSWASDNWIGDIYHKDDLKFIIPHRLYNLGGSPRYKVPTDYIENYKKSMKKYKCHIKNFISQNELYSIY